MKNCRVTKKPEAIAQVQGDASHPVNKVVVQKIIIG
jgi:hypothetical protein